MSETTTQIDPVTKVARDLTEIEDMAARLEEQAIHKANDRELPGGAAMVSLAGVANLEAWQNIVDTALRLAYEYGEEPPELDDEDDWEPPLQTLQFWSEDLRREHGDDYDRRYSIGSEVGYLRHMLNWMWENEPKWDDFARDIRKARVRLENTLYDGRRAERSRVRCIDVECEKQPRLVKVYRRTAAFDHHKCPACKRQYDGHDYARAKAELLSSQGADRHVTAQDAFAAIDRSGRTWRKWLRYWYVRSYRDPLTGVVWVWWPDVREMDRDTPRRNRQVA